MTSRSRKGSSTPINSNTPTPLQQQMASSTATPSGNTTGGGGGSSNTTATSASNLAGAGRSASPLSPTRHSRLAEKVELQNLNDRLACYIDRVRYLENENARLSVEIQTSHETITRETSNIKQMYEHELSDARKLLDETAREKAKLEIDTKRLWEENGDLKSRLDKKTKELAVVETSARMYEIRSNELTNKYNTASAERKKAYDDVKELEKECDKLRKQFDDYRKHLEEETLARVDLENTIQSLREELTFKDQIHSQELTETRTRRQVDISEIDGRLSEQYEAKLQRSLQELRDQYEAQMRSNRDEIDTLYDAKLKNLQNASVRNAKAASTALEELRILKTRNDTRATELEALNATLNARIRDLENQLDLEMSRRAGDEAELAHLREEMAMQLQEYQDLMDTKVSLDLEIAAYDKLLSGEEMRLNITPSNNTADSSTAQLSQSSLLSRSGRATPIGRRGAVSGSSGKRKRSMLEESEERNLSDFSVTASAKGDVEIVDVGGDGKFVKLHNKGAKEINIGGWQLLRTAGVNETSFRFHRSVKIDGGATITIWSSDSGVTHEPPANIVMKQQKWFAGDNIKTQLLNSDGEEMAASERVRYRVSSHASRHRETKYGSRVSGGIGEDLYHQQVRRSPVPPVGRLFSFW